MVTETKARPFSFDRVQEITVYISSCITWVSKLSGFGGGEGDTSLQTQYRLRLIIPDCSGVAMRRKLLISSLFCSGPAVFALCLDRLSADAEDL